MEHAAAQVMEVAVTILLVKVMMQLLQSDDDSMVRDFGMAQVLTSAFSS